MSQPDPRRIFFKNVTLYLLQHQRTMATCNSTTHPNPIFQKKINPTWVRKKQPNNFLRGCSDPFILSPNIWVKITNPTWVRKGQPTTTECEVTPSKRKMFPRWLYLIQESTPMAGSSSHCGKAVTHHCPVCSSGPHSLPGMPALCGQTIGGLRQKRIDAVMFKQFPIFGFY